MNDKPKRQVNRTWDEAEREKHGKQVRERFALLRDEKIRLGKQVIADLLDQGLTISQNEVARQSGISVGFINKHLKFEVERARKKQLDGAKKPKTPRQVETVEKEVERLKLTNRRLKDELDQEKRKNKELLAQVAQVVDLEDEIELLKQQNRELVAYWKASQEKVVNLPLQPLLINSSNSPDEESKPISTSSESLDFIKQVTEELKSLGITLNSTLKKTIKTSSPQTVLDAVEAFKAQLNKQDIPNPGGWLNKAIKEGWTPAGPIRQPPQSLPSTSNEVNTSPDKKLISADKLKSLNQSLSNLFKDRNDE